MSMPDDPLTKPIEAWTLSDLENLRGASESEYLELKGDEVDIASTGGRSSIARAVAGLMSGFGGYLILGATSGTDTFEGYPGLAVNSDDIDALTRSVMDRVRPHALVRGPMVFDGESEASVVVVFQVPRHPTGLPAAADGIFWIRTGAETRRMDYNEVRRRFSQARDLTEEALRQADEASEAVAEPIRNQLYAIAQQRGHPELRLEPLTVACVPIASSRDLARSGTELLDVFRTSVVRVTAAFSERMSTPLPDLAEPARVTVDGVEAGSNGLQMLLLGHDGIYAAAWTTIVEPLASGSGASPSYVESLAAMLTALGLDMIHRLIGPVAVHISLCSGSTRGLPPNGGVDQSRLVARHEYEAPARGPDAVAATSHGSRLLAVRAFEALGVGSSTSVEADVAAFLSDVLAS